METGIKFLGSVEVSINPTLLEATIHLRKDGSEHWNSEKLYKFLASQGVREGYNKKDLEYQIEQFLNSPQKESSFVFARGTLPVPPIPEEVEWKEFVVPEELKSIAERLQKKYASPVVYQIKTQKVQVPRQVEKAGKKETILETKTQEIKEKVVVSPQTVAVGYFEEGDLVATIYPARPGKPGRDLMGASVPPPPPAVHQIYLGDDIEKTREGYRVKRSGFVRRGVNWLDLIPYQAHRFEIRYNDSRTAAYLAFFPGSNDAPPITADMVLKKLQEDGFDTSRVVSKGSIDSFLRETLLKGQPAQDWPLVQDSDSFYRINVSTDRLTATLTVQKALGKGKPLDLDALSRDLQALRSRFINVNDVLKQVREFLKGPQLTLENLVIGRGRPPGRNPDRVLSVLVPFLDAERWKRILLRLQSSPSLIKEVEGLDEFPLEEVQNVAIVEQNAVVAELTHGTGNPGTPGMDLFGETIPPYPGNDPKIKFWGDIRRAGDQVIAFSPGLVQIRQRGEVTELRLVKYRDARVEVIRSPDLMSARINLYQAVGAGEPLTTTMVMDALREEQVLEGIDHQAIAHALEVARKTGKAEAVEVARGKKPGSNLETRLKFLVEVKHDLRRGALVAPVTAGKEFAHYRPLGDECEDGVDIMGNTIPCTRDQVEDLRIGPHITTRTLSGDGQIALVAEKNGEVVFKGAEIRLQDSLLLKGATKARGVYRFPGDILIEGDVESGVAIYSGGDVKISGNLGDCLVSGGNNVIVAGSIRGEGKAVLSSRKHLSVQMAERANLFSVGDTFIEKSALDCVFKCNSRVFQKKPDGTIAGGRIKSKFGIEVYNLGHPSRRETLVSFGQDYLVEDQIIVEEREIEKIRQAIVTLDKLMLKYASPQYRQQLDAVRKKKVVLMKLLEKRGRKLIFLRDKFEAHFPSEVVVKGTVYPGVLIESHGRVYEVLERKSAVRITFNVISGKIEESPL